jgi:hypothetical protein
MGITDILTVLLLKNILETTLLNENTSVVSHNEELEESRCK